MLSCLFILSIALLPSQTPSWQTAVDRLAPHMASFGSTKGTDDQRNERFNNLLGKLDLGPSYDLNKSKPLPGFFLDSSDTVIPIKGTKSGSLVFLQQGPDETEISDAAAYGVFLKERGRMRGFSLSVSDLPFDDLIQPRYAALCKDKLIIMGQSGWIGSLSVQATEIWTYKRTGKGWKRFLRWSYDVNGECESGLRVSKDLSHVLPFTLKSWRYPDNLHAVYAAAKKSYSHRWQIVEGRPKLLWEKVDDTPYNVLDELYGAIRKLNRKVIMNRSINRSIYRKLVALKPLANKEEQDIQFPHSFNDGNSKLIGLTDLKASFHFRRFHGRWVVWKIGPISECQ